MIFIGGVHGVGKSYFCDKVLSKLGIKSYTASSLIAELKNEQFTRDKKIKDIESNQNYLLEAVNRLSTNKEEFLLDGHFCLLDGNGKVKRIPVTTFAQLLPKAIIVPYDSIEIIASRLNKRDGVRHELTTIEAFQREELAFSQEIAKDFNIPYLALNNGTSLDEAYTFIIKHIA